MSTSVVSRARLAISERPSTWLESWNLQAHPQTPGREEGLEIKFNHVINYSINHAYVIKPQIKALDTEAQGSFLLGEQEGVHSVSMGTDASGSCSMFLFIWLFICILYSNMVIVNIALFWVLWVILEKYWHSGGVGSSKFVVPLKTGIWSKGSLVGDLAL